MWKCYQLSTTVPTSSRTFKTLTPKSNFYLPITVSNDDAIISNPIFGISMRRTEKQMVQLDSWAYLALINIFLSKVVNFKN